MPASLYNHRVCEALTDPVRASPGEHSAKGALADGDYDCDYDTYADGIDDYHTDGGPGAGDPVA